MADNVMREWTYYSYGKGTQPTGVQILWEGPAVGGYEWEQLSLVRREHGDGFQYAAYIDSGCSCNGPYESEPDRYSLTWHYTKDVPRAELQRAVRDSYYLNDGEKTEARRSLRNA